MSDCRIPKPCTCDHSCAELTLTLTTLYGQAEGSILKLQLRVLKEPCKLQLVDGSTYVAFIDYSRPLKALLGAFSKDRKRSVPPLFRFNPRSLLSMLVYSRTTSATPPPPLRVCMKQMLSPSPPLSLLPPSPPPALPSSPYLAERRIDASQSLRENGFNEGNASLVLVNRLRPPTSSTIAGIKSPSAPTKSDFKRSAVVRILLSLSLSLSLSGLSPPASALCSRCSCPPHRWVVI